MINLIVTCAIIAVVAFASFGLGWGLCELSHRQDNGNA